MTAPVVEPLLLADFTGAACYRAGSNASLFDSENPLHLQKLAALRYCRGCPIQRACLDDALAERSSGVFGGHLLRGGARPMRLSAAVCGCAECAAFRSEDWSRW